MIPEFEHPLLSTPTHPTVSLVPATYLTFSVFTYQTYVEMYKGRNFQKGRSIWFKSNILRSVTNVHRAKHVT